MAVPQQKIREMVLQMLYSRDISDETNLKIVGDLLQKELKVGEETTDYVCQRVQKIHDLQKDIDALLAKTSMEYTFDRIQLIERNILRLGVYELLYDDDIPPKVAISEAIRLTRKFGSPEGGSFVNAILDKLHKPEEPA